MFSIENSGFIKNVGQSFEVSTRSGAFAGIISESFKTGAVKVWFNTTATKGSARKFASINEALSFIYSRRVSKGWRV